MLEPSTLTHKRYAICVGINTYIPSSELTSLRFSEHDAQAMDDTLGTLGFEQHDRVLLLGEQATLVAINKALNEMTDRAEENDLVVFYFAGHGAPLYFEKDDTRDVFLASYDFDPQQLEQRRSLRTRDALGMERLRREYFEGQGSRKRLFLFDSCYSGEFAGFRSGGERAVQQHMQKVLDSKSTGRVALLSCLPEQVAVETVKHGHGRFTYYLLQALQGKAADALRRDGWLTINTLFEYLSQQLPEAQRPVLSGIQYDAFEIVCYPDLVRPASELTSALHRASVISEKEAYVRAMLADHTDFLRDRLESFVGRDQEIAELRQRISDKMPTGGYVIITGQAGQGKSSIMAKLIDAYGREQVPFHFVPFNPGPDHQVGLLRNLMARLVLKYQLSEIYVSAENRATLRDYFPNVLREVAAKGGQEFIFIDGLDQIEEDMNGVRDLSFLPTNPPAGIVFVLATRPDDALRPLVLLKPHEQYPLPNLRREDFDLILRHRGVALERHLVDRFYQAMSENALYLDLVAKELHENPGFPPQEMIAHITHNPDNIFTLAITRFKRQPLEWREVIKPILGVLLTAREPLSSWHMRQILGLDDDRLRDGIMRLGGLLRESGQRCYSLFHLKLQEYLHQNEQLSGKDYVFAIDEEEQWHDRLATWCEPLTCIWADTQNTREQRRREYARYHYITHLYEARRYEKLFGVLDDGVYGVEKEKYDRTSRSYIQDLDLGRRAAILYGEEINNAITALPILWKYTLLRSSLRSQADYYPESLYQVILLLHREREALGLVELITKNDQRAKMLALLGLHYAKNTRPQESVQIFLRAVSVALEIEHSSDRVGTLLEIVKALMQAQQWERVEVVLEDAESAVSGIKDAYEKIQALHGIVELLMQAKQWGRAEAAARRIENISARGAALREIAEVLTQACQWERAEMVARGIEDTYEKIQALRGIAEALIQVRFWKRAKVVLGDAEVLARGIEDVSKQSLALSGIAEALIQVQQWERAEVAARGIENTSARGIVLRRIAEKLAWAKQWKRSEIVARRIKDISARAIAFHGIVEALAQAGQWERAEMVARGIEDASERIQALHSVAEALIQAQLWERAEPVIENVEMLAKEIDNVSERVEILSGIAEVLAQAKQWERACAVFDDAEELASKATDNSHREWTLRGIAEALIRVRLWKRAEVVAKRIEDPFVQVQILREIVKALIQAQQWERAEMVARGIENASYREWVLRGIIDTLAQAHQWERAEAVAREIKDIPERARALSRIVETLIQAQQWKRANVILEEAEAVARRIENVSARGAALHGVADALLQAQQWERAEVVIREIGDVSVYARAVRGFVKALAQTQQWEKANVILGDAEAVARGIENVYERILALCKIADTLLQAKQWKSAVAVLGDAEAVARGIENNSERILALREIVEALTRVQQWERAEIIARGMENDYERIRTLCRIVEALAQSEQRERSVAVLGDAEAVARGMENDYDRTQTLRGIVGALIQAQQWERAEMVARGMENDYDRTQTLCGSVKTLAQAEHWEKAEMISRWIEDASRRTQALCEIAGILLQAQQWARAEVVLKDAETVARKFKETSGQAEVLCKIAGMLLQVQQLERAEVVLKDAETVARQIDIISWQTQRLHEIVKVLLQAQQWARAEVVAKGITDALGRAKALHEIAEALARAQQWERAEEVAQGIETASARATALSAIAEALARAQQWERAEEVATEIEHEAIRVQALRAIAEALAQKHCWNLLIELIQRAWLVAETREYAFQLLPLAYEVIKMNPHLGISLVGAFAQVDAFISQ